LLLVSVIFIRCIYCFLLIIIIIIIITIFITSKTYTWRKETDISTQAL